MIPACKPAIIETHCWRVDAKKVRLNGLLQQPRDHFDFRVADLLLTNFHPPKSMLLMLIESSTASRVEPAGFRKPVHTRR